jgi:bifunctional non-homologous end joining protein LigD
MLRERLETMGFHIFLRTTGGKGLHLVVALETKHDWPTVKGFAHAVAQAMAKDHSNLFVAMASKERRKSRIYIDYLRNGRGASAVSSYSLRARPSFPVAVPIAWEELRALAGGDAFNRVNLWRRMETLAADPWDELESSAAQITPRMRRDVGMK